MHFTLIDTNPKPALDLPQDMEPELALLLHTYKEVFQKPETTTPRLHDHCIPLIEGLGLVKVKLYGYPYSKKEHIEIMVQEMLNEGII